MSQNRRNYQKAAYDKNRKGTRGKKQTEYIYGNTVRKVDFGWEETPVRRPDPKVRKNRERARHMSAGYVLFLAAALLACGWILVNYIQLQSQLTTLTKTVARRESELNQMKISNDETYNRIISNIDLEEIRKVAMGELGMVYAEEGQIVTYDGKSSDYMRKVSGNGGKVSGNGR